MNRDTHQTSSWKKKLTTQRYATLLVSQGLDATTRVFTRNKRNRPPSLLLWWVLPVSHPLQLDTGHMGTRPAPFSTHVFHWCFPVHKLWRFLFDGFLNRHSLTFEMIFFRGICTKPICRIVSSRVENITRSYFTISPALMQRTWIFFLNVTTCKWSSQTRFFNVDSPSILGLGPTNCNGTPSAINAAENILRKQTFRVNACTAIFHVKWGVVNC